VETRVGDLVLLPRILGLEATNDLIDPEVITPSAAIELGSVH
jgi:hypothetical protein